MGRYYSGDIEGKFWFAVQSSYAADRFGVIMISGIGNTYSLKSESRLCCVIILKDFRGCQGSIV